MSIDDKGRCCGRKPMVYKREAHLFCDRCCRSYDPTSHKQIKNWAWSPAPGGVGFVATHPTHDYAQKGN